MKVIIIVQIKSKSNSVETLLSDGHLKCFTILEIEPVLMCEKKIE